MHDQEQEDGGMRQFCSCGRVAAGTRVLETLFGEPCASFHQARGGQLGYGKDDLKTGHVEVRDAKVNP